MKKIVEDVLAKTKCIYKEWCWRLVYTCVLQEIKYSLKEAPDRFDVLCAGNLAGFANIYPRSGVYCKNLPYFDGHKMHNICPDSLRCAEYIYESNLQKKRGKFGKAKNLSHNVKRVRSRIAPSIRRSIYREHKFNCVYCGININQNTPDGKKVVMTIDHRVPINMGGTDEYDNLVLACRTCNSIKKDQIWKLGCRK